MPAPASGQRTQADGERRIGAAAASSSRSVGTATAVSSSRSSSQPQQASFATPSLMLSATAAPGNVARRSGSKTSAGGGPRATPRPPSGPAPSSRKMAPPQPAASTSASSKRNGPAPSTPRGSQPIILTPSTDFSLTGARTTIEAAPPAARRPRSSRQAPPPAASSSLRRSTKRTSVLHSSANAAAAALPTPSSPPPLSALERTQQRMAEIDATLANDTAAAAKADRRRLRKAGTTPAAAVARDDDTVFDPLLERSAADIFAFPGSTASSRRPSSSSSARSARPASADERRSPDRPSVADLVASEMAERPSVLLRRLAASRSLKALAPESLAVDPDGTPAEAAVALERQRRAPSQQLHTQQARSSELSVASEDLDDDAFVFINDANSASSSARTSVQEDAPQPQPLAPPADSETPPQAEPSFSPSALSAQSAPQDGMRTGVAATEFVASDDDDFPSDDNDDDFLDSGAPLPLEAFFTINGQSQPLGDIRRLNGCAPSLNRFALRTQPHVVPTPSAIPAATATHPSVRTHSATHSAPTDPAHSHTYHHHAQTEYDDSDVFSRLYWHGKTKTDAHSIHHFCMCEHKGQMAMPAAPAAPAAPAPVPAPAPTSMHGPSAWSTRRSTAPVSAPTPTPTSTHPPPPPHSHSTATPTSAPTPKPSSPSPYPVVQASAALSSSAPVPRPPSPTPIDLPTSAFADLPRVGQALAGDLAMSQRQRPSIIPRTMQTVRRTQRRSMAMGQIRVLLPAFDDEPEGTAAASATSPLPLPVLDESIIEEEGEQGEGGAGMSSTQPLVRKRQAASPAPRRYLPGGGHTATPESRGFIQSSMPALYASSRQPLLAQQYRHGQSHYSGGHQGAAGAAGGAQMLGPDGDVSAGRSPAPFARSGSYSSQHKAKSAARVHDGDLSLIVGRAAPNAAASAAESNTLMLSASRTGVPAGEDDLDDRLLPQSLPKDRFFPSEVAAVLAPTFQYAAGDGEGTDFESLLAERQRQRDALLNQAPPEDSHASQLNPRISSHGPAVRGARLSEVEAEIQRAKAGLGGRNSTGDGGAGDGCEEQSTVQERGHRVLGDAGMASADAIVDANAQMAAGSPDPEQCERLAASLVGEEAAADKSDLAGPSGPAYTPEQLWASEDYDVLMGEVFDQKLLVAHARMSGVLDYHKQTAAQAKRRSKAPRVSSASSVASRRSLKSSRSSAGGSKKSKKRASGAEDPAMAAAGSDDGSSGLDAADTASIPSLPPAASASALPVVAEEDASSVTVSSAEATGEVVPAAAEAAKNIEDEQKTTGVDSGAETPAQSDKAAAEGEPKAEGAKAVEKRPSAVGPPGAGPEPPTETPDDVISIQSVAQLHGHLPLHECLEAEAARLAVLVGGKLYYPEEDEEEEKEKEQEGFGKEEVEKEEDGGEEKEEEQEQGEQEEVKDGPSGETPPGQADSLQHLHAEDGQAEKKEEPETTPSLDDTESLSISDPGPTSASPPPDASATPTSTSNPTTPTSATTAAPDDEPAPSHAENLCRYGTVLRRLGHLRAAEDMLWQALQLESGLVDALWNLHLVHLALGLDKVALNDAQAIVKEHHQHWMAHRSRGDILLRLGQTTSAISAYDIALVMNRRDCNGFLQRARALAALGQTERAVDDYRAVIDLRPHNLEALRACASHDLERGHLAYAAKQCTLALEHNQRDAECHYIRAQCLQRQGKYEEALRDLSQCIHLNPNFAKTYYQRACLLREAHPQQALQDYSVALMLFDREEDGNLIIRSYLHRAFVYIGLKRFEPAVPDLHKVLLLDQLEQLRTGQRGPRPMAICAHMQLGLINMNVRRNLGAALRCFTRALQADPTYIDAYLCRAECYQRVHRLCGSAPKAVRQGLRDYASAIHLAPHRPELHILRGRLLLEESVGLDLPTMHIRAAIALQPDIGADRFAQARVKSFLGDHDEAANLLQLLVTDLVAQSSNLIDVRTRKSQTSTRSFLTKAMAEQGRVLMRAGRLREAFTAFENTLYVDRANAHVFYDLGLCAAKMQDDELAHEAFSSSIRLNSQHYRAYYERGTCKLRLGNSRGLQDINRALALKPDMWQAYLTRASYYGMLGRYAKAILNCQHAIELQPRSVRAFLTSGCLKFLTGQADLAVEDLGTAIALDPNCSLAFYNRAVCLQHLGRLQEALRDYSIVLLLEEGPSHLVHLNRGIVYFLLEDWANATHEFLLVGEAGTLKNDPRILHTIALCQHRLGNLETAVACHTRALEIDPLFSAALIGRGNAYMDHGSKEGWAHSRYDFCRVIRTYPAEVAGYLNLAFSLQATGNFKQAWDLLGNALRIDPREPSVLDARAVISLQMGNYAGAMADLSKAIEALEDSSLLKPELYSNRGVVHLYMQNRRLAMMDFQAAIKLDAKCALALYNAANLYTVQRQLQQALDYYNRAVAIVPDDESFLVNRGVCLALAGKLEEAEKDFDRVAELTPSCAHIFFDRGNVRAELKRWADAESDFNAFLELQPLSIAGYERKSFVLGKLDRADAAMEDSVRAATLQYRRDRG